jgi:hypothetical protein
MALNLTKNEFINQKLSDLNELEFSESFFSELLYSFLTTHKKLK